MLKIILSALVTFIGFSALAGGGSITCSTNAYDSSVNNMVILADRVIMQCSDGYNVAINGIGIGLRFGGVSGHIVSCIGDVNDLSGNYYGAKADVAFIFGLTAATYVGKKGVCAIGAASVFSFGAGASISSLQVYR